MHTEQEVAECVLEDHQPDLAVHQLGVQEVVEEVSLLQTTLDDGHFFFHCFQNSRVRVVEAQVYDVGKRFSNFA